MNSVQDQANAAYEKAGIRQTTIKGKNYTIILLPALPAFLLGTELLEAILPSLGSGVDNGLSLEEMFPEDRAMFTQIALHLTKSLKDLDKVNMVNQLLQGATCSGQPIDIHGDSMRGDISSFVSLIEFSLKENFTDFFTDYLKEKGLEISTLMEGLMSKAVTSAE